MEIRTERDDLYLTLWAYAKQHSKEFNHPTLVYGNFTACKHCGDHAHYYEPGIMIRHNRDYSINEKIQVSY